jgi:hypothetical protein
MFGFGLIILTLIGLVGVGTHNAFASNPTMPPDSAGIAGGGTGSSGGGGTSDSPGSDNPPAGWLAGHEEYGGPGHYGLWRHEHHHLWGSDFWRDQRLRNQDYYWNKYMNEPDREHIHPLNAPIVRHHPAFEYPGP